MAEAPDKQNPHLDNILKKVVGDFDKRVKAESDISNVLLKGHLLIESLLLEVLAVLNVNEVRRITRLSFHEKVKCLDDQRQSEDLKDSSIIKQTIHELAPALFALNDVRNNLSHRIDFQVTESDVDRIGVNSGSAFILQKYESGHSRVRENLLFCLNRIEERLGLIIFIRVEYLKKNQNNSKPDKKKGAVK